MRVAQLSEVLIVLFAVTVSRRQEQVSTAFKKLKLSRGLRPPPYGCLRQPIPIRGLRPLFSKTSFRKFTPGRQLLGVRPLRGQLFNGDRRSLFSCLRQHMYYFAIQGIANWRPSVAKLIISGRRPLICDLRGRICTNLRP